MNDDVLSSYKFQTMVLLTLPKKNLNLKRSLWWSRKLSVKRPIGNKACVFPRKSWKSIMDL